MVAELSLKKALWRIPEAAEELSVSERHVRNLLDCGELETVCVNSESKTPDSQRAHIRITAKSILNFIERRKQ
jgi:hypothetical protein